MNLLRWYRNIPTDLNVRKPSASSVIVDDNYQPPDDDMALLTDDTWAIQHQELPERERPDQERDASDWYNPYNEPEQRPPDEYPFHNFNYGP